jgi:NitT/TauT family transport system ATP-binding protein
MSELGTVTVERQAGALPIVVDAVSKTYVTRDGNVEALRSVGFTAGHGQFTSLVGPSGCGKSTLLKIAAGLEPPSLGSVTIAGTPARAGRPDCGIMFQSAVLLPWRSLLDNVLLPTEVMGLDKAASRERALELLRTVGLDGFESKHPWELSGGMQQRASLARLLVFDPSILMLDEPFAALDEFTRERLIFVLSGLHERLRRSVLYVTHHVIESVLLSDRVVVMKPRPGEIVDIVDIDLPRPRTVEMLDRPRTVELVAEVRRALRSFSVPEDIDDQQA